MKLSVTSVKYPHNVVITPDAPWLNLIARDLSPSSPEKARIQGELSLNADSAGFITASGHLKAQATLPCDRCGKDTSIPLETKVTAIFRPEYQENAPREMTLSPEDLEVYFIENDAVDLEVLVNDSLQCALPNHVLCGSDGDQPCEDPDDGLVYRDSTEFKAESPFAVLKNLKKS